VFGKPIIFADDIIGSGKRSASIVRAWLGDMRLADELGECRQTLPSEVRSLLFNRPIAFCFAAGLDDGHKCLGEALDEVKMAATIVVGSEKN